MPWTLAGMRTESARFQKSGLVTSETSKLARRQTPEVKAAAAQKAAETPAGHRIYPLNGSRSMLLVELTANHPHYDRA